MLERLGDKFTATVCDLMPASAGTAGSTCRPTAGGIDAAGSLLADADIAKLPNLAGKLTDGKQVKVPRLGTTTATASRVDINSATVDELMVVPDAATDERRLDQFHRQIEPLLDFCGRRGVLITVDADQAPDAVTAAIVDGLDAAGRRP